MMSSLSEKLLQCSMCCHMFSVGVSSLTLFPPKTNIFVHGKNCTFSKKGLGHKGRCYSVCFDDTCKWISHILSRIIGPSNTASKIRVPISNTGHMVQISTANLSCMFMQSSCVFMHVYLCSCIFMQVHAKFICVHAKFTYEYSKYQYQSTSPSVVATDNFGWTRG